MKQNKQQYQIGILIVVVFIIGFVLGNQYTISSAQNGNGLPDDVAHLFDPFYETYNYIDSQYINMPEVEILVDGAISGMVEALDDPYSNYVDPESFPFVDSSLSGQIEGIGAVITIDEETEEIYILNVIANSPAEKAGLKNDDTFILVDGEEVTGLTTLELAARVRGEKGTIVNLTMRRGEELIEFAVERDTVQIPNVDWKRLDGDIGYISMAQFNSVSRSQVDTALQKLDPASLNGLIFDLRGNGGGLLSTATEIAGLFIEDGIILIEEFGNGDKHTFKIVDGNVIQIRANGNEVVYAENADFSGVTAPVVVLIDGRSASASELVAGAWQDLKVATIIGETSFGKGTVQIQNRLTNGGGLRITVARWLTPDGDWISEQGITPDISVEIAEDAEFEQGAVGEDPVLDAALKFINNQQAE